MCVCVRVCLRGTDREREWGSGGRREREMCLRYAVSDCADHDPSFH